MGHTKEELEKYPGIKNIYLRAFEKMLKVRELRERETEWKTAQEVYDWWVSGLNTDKRIVGELPKMIEGEQNETM